MTSPQFHRCLELAWEAYCSGSFPVGALVCDASGTVVAEGRNRVGETDAPPGQLRRTALAHGEMDVLAQLPMGDYADHVLYTSLEPCLLCRSAATMTHIGAIHYLAADAVCDGLDGIRSLNGHASRRYPTLHGPFPGPESDAAAILPMAVLMAFNPTGDTAEHYRTYAPRHAAAAARLVSEDAWPSRDLDVDAMVAHIAALLPH
jgi:tRNA(Arg) A34 adenosine deaminase TadA